MSLARLSSLKEFVNIAHSTTAKKNTESIGIVQQISTDHVQKVIVPNRIGVFLVQR